MTGYGAARASGSRVAVEVEIRSVNARAFKLNARLSGQLAAKEADLEALVRRHLRRGTVALNVKLQRVRPQVSRVVINANRNRERYEGFGCPVIEDISGGYLGPLVGMASGLAASDSDYLLAVPCDSPLVPEGLAERLYLALQSTGARIAVAHDGARMQPVFSLLKRDLLPDLRQYLEHGGRKIDTWYAQHPTALADFSEYPDAFLNINTEEERQELERKLTGRRQ